MAKTIAALGGRTATTLGNIGDQAAVKKMKSDIESALGEVEILVGPCADRRQLLVGSIDLSRS